MSKCLPKIIKIDNIYYKVKITKNLREDNKRKGQKLLGCVDFTQALIQLEGNVDNLVLNNTLAHEITHAILYERNIVEMIPEPNREEVTDKIAKAIVQLIIENPILINFIRRAK